MKLSGVDKYINTYKTYISESWFRWPNIRSILIPHHYKAIGNVHMPLIPKVQLGTCYLSHDILTRAAESTNFKRLRLRLRPENTDSDSSSDSASTPDSILKRAIWCNHFLDFTFDCIQMGSTAPVRANSGCSRPWLSLIPLNMVSMIVFKFVDIIAQRSRWP